MKTVYSTIIVSLLLFSEALFPNYAGAVVCQNKTAIVYSNGMFNDADEAGTSKKELFKKLLASNLIYGDSDLYEYHLAYADEKDGLGNTVKDQLMEVYYQKQAGLLSSFWRWLGSVEVAPQWFHEQMLLMAQATTAINFSIDPDFQKMLNGGGTTGNPGYRKLLIDGKRVLIVSHSQGNFYANAVYETLTQEKPAWSSSIGNVQVATPAGYVASGGPYTTVPEDAAMAFIPGKLVPSGSVSSQAYNLLPYSLVVSPNFVNLGSTAWEKASRGHSFVNWYLAWSYTRDRILGHIVTTVGGLQYPKKCALSPPIPQPGPFYYRDDWGDLTYDKPIPDLSPYFVVRDPHRQFKHLRDDRRGFAYKVQLSQKIDRASNWYDGPHQMRLGITDYTTNQFGSLYYVFPDTFVPDDVVLWSGGIMLLRYDYTAYNKPTQVTWRKISIQDAGVGAANRWLIGSIVTGTFSFPAYRVTNYEKTGFAISSPYRYVTRMQYAWNKVGVAYRDSTSYTYRIPYTASRAEWTNAPVGLFGYFVNGQYKSPPNVPTKTWLGDYGALEVIDGNLSFVKEGWVPLVSNKRVQPSIPIINGFAKLKQSMAYKYMQSFLVDADKVDEIGSLKWSGYIMLKAVLAKGKYFFSPPQSLHRSFSRGSTGIPQYSARRYSEIFNPFSLSSSMAMLSGAGVSLPWFSQANTTSYKLGSGFKINSNDPRFQATNPLISLPRVTRTGGSVQVSAEQKVFMENTTNSVP